MVVGIKIKCNGEIMMGYPTELTSKINQTGKTKRYIQKELEISQWKLDGFSSGRLEAKKWERIGLLAALDVMIDKNP